MSGEENSRFFPHVVEKTSERLFQDLRVPYHVVHHLRIFAMKATERAPFATLNLIVCVRTSSLFVVGWDVSWQGA